MTNDADAIATGSTYGLFAIVCTNTPALPQAACKGCSSTYDAAANGHIDAQQIAKDICDGCREVTACSQWAATLSADELITLGVVGGDVYAPVRTEGELRRRAGSAARVATNTSSETPRTRRRRYRRVSKG
jgi:hypothetical protein